MLAMFLVIGGNLVIDATLPETEDNSEVDDSSGVASLRPEREPPVVDKGLSPSALGNL